MEWLCKKEGGVINVFLDNKFDGNYVLMKEPYCKKCACPEVTTDSCKHNHSLDGFDRAYAIGVYYPTRLNKDEMLSAHILKLKTEQSYAVPLGLSLALVIKELYPELLDSELLAPIPLSDEEFAKRGYNQSTELMKVVSKAINLPFVEALQKTRTQGMTQLPWHKRHFAVNNLYQIQNCEKIGGKRVLLVDDVMTTGLTCSECSTVLKSNGAKSVNVVVAGRTFYSK